MGNGLSPCVSKPATAPAAVRLVYWGGRTRVLLVNDDEDDAAGCSTAGDVAAELLPPGGHVVCPSDSFYVGLPIPVTPPTERLLPGRTYFVLPATRFSLSSDDGKAPVLTAATLASLSAAPGSKKRVSLAGPGECPFEYVKAGEHGAAPLIRVLPEFIEKMIACDGASDGAVRRGKCGVAAAASATELCSTPELKRHYAQLVGARSRPWSPRLETISERRKRRVFPSPARLLLLASH
ncbi:uncharacterized protein LOC124659695 [Lolium rigidum]|uniref:uncharacterized protein LOC124659695 n=1 Tax=Lolium rigidum TaxID=89674 RepID=UPI001F5CE240|nr:uncharacterized protein LOC124659695 [Lolium rigidum]